MSQTVLSVALCAPDSYRTLWLSVQPKKIGTYTEEHREFTEIHRESQNDLNE